MEISNKRTQYSITETKDGFTLKGEVSVLENGTISSLSGNIQDENSTYCGDFYYGESQDKKITKNLTNINNEYLDTIEGIVSGIISEIKK